MGAAVVHFEINVYKAKKAIDSTRSIRLVIGSVEPDPLVPMRDVRRKAKCPDLRLEGDLAFRVAVDQEDAAWIARVARSLSGREPA